MGNVLIVILIVLAALGALYSLVRGIVVFLKTTEADLNNMSAGPSESGLKQNKMMMSRVMFQAMAVLFVALLLLVNSGK